MYRRKISTKYISIFMKIAKKATLYTTLITIGLITFAA